MILISADDHVVEPPDMFEGHVPDRWKDKAPYVVLDPNGAQQWVFSDAVSMSIGLNAVVGWPKEEWGLDPAAIAEMRPGAYDVNERVRDMNRNGILASMCFPSFAGFSGGFFLNATDKDLALVMLKAYNDWHIDEFAASHPGRFIPLAIPPLWDAQALADEIRRVARKGCRAITMPELPHLVKLPSYHDLTYWGPVFEALCDEGVVMCLHIGQGFGALRLAPDSPIDNLMILATQIAALAANDLLWGGAMREFPELRIAWSEAGIGWIPFYLDRCDRHYNNQRWLGHDFGGQLPSDIFRKHCLACYVSDPTSLRVRDAVGIETIAWECDYPHSDSVFPDAAEFVLAQLNDAGCTDEEIDLITWRNSSRFLRWDPFKHIPREAATVQALRASSPDVDTIVRSRVEWRARYEASLAQ